MNSYKRKRLAYLFRRLVSCSVTTYFAVEAVLGNPFILSNFSFAHVRSTTTTSDSSGGCMLRTLKPDRSHSDACLTHKRNFMLTKLSLAEVDALTAWGRHGTDRGLSTFGEKECLGCTHIWASKSVYGRTEQAVSHTKQVHRSAQMQIHMLFWIK